MDAPDARFVRIQGDKRATRFGYSLWSVEAYAVVEPGGGDERGGKDEPGDKGEPGGRAGEPGGKQEPGGKDGKDSR